MSDSEKCPTKRPIMSDEIWNVTLSHALIDVLNCTKRGRCILYDGCESCKRPSFTFTIHVVNGQQYMSADYCWLLWWPMTYTWAIVGANDDRPVYRLFTVLRYILNRFSSLVPSFFLCVGRTTTRIESSWVVDGCVTFWVINLYTTVNQNAICAAVYVRFYSCECDCAEYSMNPFEYLYSNTNSNNMKF